jgi:hypothetical protein
MTKDDCPQAELRMNFSRFIEEIRSDDDEVWARAEEGSGGHGERICGPEECSEMQRDYQAEEKEEWDRLAEGHDD